jgi:lambda repressor-like predicted transcriptional regulator
VIAFWIRADLDDAAFRGDEVRKFGPAALGALEKENLLKRGEDLQMVECDACGTPHLETVEILTEPPGSEARAYIYCPEAGRVSVELERMQVWAIDLDRLARLTSSALGLCGRIVQVAADRVWLLGTASFVDRTRDVFLVRGTTWPDSLQLIAGNARLSTSPCPLILCLNRVPDDAEWHDHERVVMSLSEFDWLQCDHSTLLAKTTEILREHPRSLVDAVTPSALQESNKVSRSIGSPAAVSALLALKDRKGWTVEQLSIEVGTTARTLQNFFKTSKVRSSVFRTMAERLGTSPEGLLKGQLPDRQD